MPRPVCIPCQRFMRPLKNGVVVLEQKPDAPDALPGNLQPDRWSPYLLWNADSFECGSCGAQVVTGFGARAFAEHFQEGFAAELERSQPVITVNDC